VDEGAREKWWLRGKSLKRLGIIFGMRDFCPRGYGEDVRHAFGAKGIAVGTGRTLPPNDGAATYLASCSVSRKRARSECRSSTRASSGLPELARRTDPAGGVYPGD
jgi:hypothetical protein